MSGRLAEAHRETFVDVLGVVADTAADGRIGEFTDPIRDAFLYSEPGEACRRMARHRLAAGSLLHPDVQGGPEAGGSRLVSARHPEHMFLLDFDDWPAFQRWDAGAEEIWRRLTSAGLRCVLRGQYLRLRGTLERGPRRSGPRFVNWVGLPIANPGDPDQVDAWLRVYARYMTTSVFATHPEIKRLTRYRLFEQTVDGRPNALPQRLPSTLTSYEFDSWEDFLSYHHAAQETDAGRERNRGRKVWAEKLAGVKAPAAGDFLFRAQYEVVETLDRL
jgi:hypothetical protein